MKMVLSSFSYRRLLAKLSVKFCQTVLSDLYSSTYIPWLWFEGNQMSLSSAYTWCFYPYLCRNCVWWEQRRAKNYRAPHISSLSVDLKLPYLFAAWLFRTVQNQSHNMKAFVVLIHSWDRLSKLILYDHPYSHLLVYTQKMWVLLEYVHKNKLPPDQQFQENSFRMR